jgi:site-specific recombinase XerD
MLNVHVYNRHRAACPHRAKRFWKKCDCPKWITWHRDGQEHRVSADTREWNVAAARSLKIEMQYRDSLDPAPTPQAQTVEMAVKLYLLDREAQHLKSATISKLTTIFQKQMLTWFDDLGIRLLRDVTLPHLQAWRSTWKDAALASKKKQERVRGFFWFCVRNKWITDNVALGLSKIKADNRPADYFTPEEMSKIIVAADKFGKTDVQRARLKGMVYLLRWSGLAIRDAVTLERSELGDDDRLILRRAKTGVAVALPLQPQIAMYLRHLMTHSNERFFFWTGKGLPKSAVSDWQRALRRLFELADLKHADGARKRCHPHMFRHTFSIEMLLAGVPIEDVARLLGHSSIKTTEKYYASWVKSRADRLEESVKAAWVSR